MVLNGIGRYVTVWLVGTHILLQAYSRYRGVEENSISNRGKIWPLRTVWIDFSYVVRNFKNSRLRLPILLCYDWYNPKQRYCIQYRYGDWYRYLEPFVYVYMQVPMTELLYFAVQKKEVMFLSSMMLFHVFYLAPCINFPRCVIIPCFILCLDLDSRIAEGK